MVFPGNALVHEQDSLSNTCKKNKQKQKESASASVPEVTASSYTKMDTREDEDRVHFALVCASNQNRSMAAHYLFLQSGLRASSFGTGTQVKLPGKSLHKPNVYEFGTKYVDMLNDLKNQDEKFYTQNGLLSMLTRNMSVKEAPERWTTRKGHYDIVFTFEDRVFDAVVEDLAHSSTQFDRPVHVINMTVKDNHEEADRNAKICVEFCSMIDRSDDWENEIVTLVRNFETENNRRLLHVVLFD
jgi:RNA polymerase II subunit A C-terminal domain phosphatase SSU72